MSENFKDFQYFADWCNNQVGFKECNYQLDKDLLVPLNKIYSEDTCVFIPKDLNCFNRVNEGAYSQGCSWHESTQKFRARIQKYGDSGRTCLGLYDTEDAAHFAYRKAKEAEAYLWYIRLLEGTLKIDQRVIERMRLWKLEDYES